MQVYALDITIYFPTDVFYYSICIKKVNKQLHVVYGNLR